MRRKHEVINGKKISVWDDGDKFADRYTVVFLDDIGESWEGLANVVYLAMGATPFHPQGFCQHGEMNLNAVAYKGRGGAFTKRIKFTELPADCQKAVLQDMEP